MVMQWPYAEVTSFAADERRLSGFACITAYPEADTADVVGVLAFRLKPGNSLTAAKSPCPSGRLGRPPYWYSAFSPATASLIRYTLVRAVM